MLRRGLTSKGTLVLVGGESRGGALFRGFDRQLRGPLLTPFISQRIRGLMAVENEQILADLTELVESGAVRPIIDRTFPLAEAPEALRRIGAGHATGKMVVNVTEH